MELNPNRIQVYGALHAFLQENKEEMAKLRMLHSVIHKVAQPQTVYTTIYASRRIHSLRRWLSPQEVRLESHEKNVYSNIRMASVT